jgi:hypothetical protein
VGQPIRASLELVEGDDRAGRVQDDRRFSAADMLTDLHG